MMLVSYETVIADVDRTRFLPKLTTAACTLHNFCIYDHDDDDGDANDFVNIFANDNNAVRKRAELMNLIC